MSSAKKRFAVVAAFVSAIILVGLFRAPIARSATALSAVISGGLYNATASNAGFATAAQITKLDGLPATVNDTYCSTWGYTTETSSTSARWASITFGAPLTTQVANAIHIAPFNATITRITARNMNGLTTDDVTYSLDVNAANVPAVSVTVPGNSTAAVTATPGSTVDINAGDSLWARIVQAGTAADADDVNGRIDICYKSRP